MIILKDLVVKQKTEPHLVWVARNFWIRIIRGLLAGGVLWRNACIYLVTCGERGEIVSGGGGGGDAGLIRWGVQDLLRNLRRLVWRGGRSRRGRRAEVWTTGEEAASACWSTNCSRRCHICDSGAAKAETARWHSLPSHLPSHYALTLRLITVNSDFLQCWHTGASASGTHTGQGSAVDLCFPSAAGKNDHDSASTYGH